MVKQLLNGGCGIASIMDAFMFLLAMMALSSFLLVAHGDPVEINDKSQELVDRAHAVLMSITVRVPLEEIGQASSPSIELTSIIKSVGSIGEMALPAWAVPEVRQTIAELLGPGWGFEWKIENFGVESTLIFQGDLFNAEEIYASSIEGGGEGSVRYILKAWND
jgi:hypothetical protein